MWQGVAVEQAELTGSGPAADILRLLRQRGPQSVKSLEGALGVTANAVREQIRRLLQAGLINVDKLRRGAGRPAHLYSLSDKGQQLFPQQHDVLLKLLLEQIAAEDGAERAQDLLKSVGARLADEWIRGQPRPDLREQLDMVVAMLARRGMPLAVVDHEDTVTLHEWSCPYHTLAREHGGICEMEQHMLEHALGTKVSIAERMVDGFAGCKFVIEKAGRGSMVAAAGKKINTPG